MDTYAEIDKTLRELREDWRHQEEAMMARRYHALRHMVSPQRGGTSEAAKALGVSDAQVLRLLSKGILAVTQSALSHAGVDRSSFQLVPQRGSRTVGVKATADGEKITEALKAVGLVLICRQQMGATKRTIQRALKSAGISVQTYSLAYEGHGDSIELFFTAVMSGVSDSVKDQFLLCLSEAGLQAEENDSTIIIEALDGDTEEMIFGWES